MIFSIDTNKIKEVLANPSQYSVAGSFLMEQPPIPPEGPVSVYGLTNAASPDLEKARQHLISLREKIGEERLLNEEQLRDRLKSIRGGD